MVLACFSCFFCHCFILTYAFTYCLLAWYPRDVLVGPFLLAKVRPPTLYKLILNSAAFSRSAFPAIINQISFRNNHLGESLLLPKIIEALSSRYLNLIQLILVISNSVYNTTINKNVTQSIARNFSYYSSFFSLSSSPNTISKNLTILE